MVGGVASRAISDRSKRFGYDELLARDKVSLDITRLRDESLEDVDDLPPPEAIAQESPEDLEAAPAELAAIAESRAKPEGGPVDVEG